MDAGDGCFLGQSNVETLKSHYRTLLGLDESWVVTEVDLSIEANRVSITQYVFPDD